MSAGRTQRVVAVAREIVTYLVAGGGAAAANFAAGELIRVFSKSALVYGASVVAGMAVGTVVSFFLHRRFTFSVADEPAAPQAVRFALVAAGGVLIALTFAEVVLGLWQLAGSPWLSRGATEAAAHVAAIGVNAGYGFLAMKFFALKRRGPPAQAEHGRP